MGRRQAWEVPLASPWNDEAQAEVLLTDVVTQSRGHHRDRSGDVCPVLLRSEPLPVLWNPILSWRLHSVMPIQSLK